MSEGPPVSERSLIAFRWDANIEDKITFCEEKEGPRGPVRGRKAETIRMSEEQPTFKVTDRRLFNSDGTPRELTPEEQQEIAASASPAAGAKETTAASPPPSGSTAQTQSERPPSPSVTSDELSGDEDAADARDPASFVNFIMSIASNAASALGMMEHPVTQQREVDLELAKHWIDVLGMLQKKTSGNLTSQEHRILDGLLSDLRMQYVSLANSPQSKTAQPYTARDIVGGK